MYDTILYPTDGSPGSEAALDSVRDLATAQDATVHIMYVVDTAHALGIGGDPQKESSPGMVGNPKGGSKGMVGRRSGSKKVREGLEERGEKIVEEAKAQLDDVETVTAVESGDPHQIILDYTEQNDIDMIVMGTHGRTGFDRYLLGSVAEKVVRLSDVPVLTVRPDEQPE